MFQPCHGHFPSSSGLFLWRGGAYAFILSEAWSHLQCTAWARLLGSQVSARCHSSPLHPTIFFLFFLLFSSFQPLMTADLAPSVLSVSPPSLLPLPLISPLPLLLCVFFMCIAFFIVTFVLWEERVVCLPNRVSLCSNRTCPRSLFFYQSVMVSFDSLSFSVRHRGRFVGFAQDEFCFFG